MISLVAPPAHTPAARNIRELLVRDVTSLLIMSHLISRSLQAVRPECAFSRELTGALDLARKVSDEGEAYLYQPLLDAGAVLPATADASALALVTGFFTRLPVAASPRALATEISINLRLLSQHVELKARLAAREARMVDEERLAQALLGWAEEWRTCGQKLYSTSVRSRAEESAGEISGFAFPLAV